MKKIIEASGEGLESLLGEYVTLWCDSYIFYGRLVGVNTDDVKLEDTHVVYETGPLSDKKFKDAQRLPGEFRYVRTSKIENYGLHSKGAA